MSTTLRERRVGVIGYGAIGSVIADALAAGVVPGAKLSGVMRLRPSIERGELATIEELLDRGCDLVIEAAGHEAVRRCGVSVMAAGRDLLVMSAGALADTEVEARLRDAGPGRLLLSTGAIGGIDILRALQLAGELRSVTITSTALPAALAGHVAQEIAGSLSNATEPIEVAAGTAREVALAFPQSTNVAATIGLATLGLDAVKAELRVDPNGRSKRHVIEAETGAGDVRIAIRNEVSPSNPKTSAVTPYAALRFLLDSASQVVLGV